jgi:hypothetical protein
LLEQIVADKAGLRAHDGVGFIDGVDERLTRRIRHDELVDTVKGGGSHEQSLLMVVNPGAE